MLLFLIGFGLGTICGAVGIAILAGTDREDEDNEDDCFGPCPRCGRRCNLEDWRCPHCHHQLHEM